MQIRLPGFKYSNTCDSCKKGFVLKWRIEEKLNQRHLCQIWSKLNFILRILIKHSNDIKSPNKR